MTRAVWGAGSFSCISMSLSVVSCVGRGGIVCCVSRPSDITADPSLISVKLVFQVFIHSVKCVDCVECVSVYSRCLSLKRIRMMLASFSVVLSQWT